ncbi:lysozyme [Sphingobium faniae]|nr:lysozyme [Sphingobium faniae]
MLTYRMGMMSVGGHQGRLLFPAIPFPMAASFSKKTLAALMGSAAVAGALTADIARWEGKKNVGYLDLAKIPTKCFGDTSDVIVGKFYSDAECAAGLDRQATVHVEGVLRCAPGLASQPQLLRASGSMAYNIGVAGWCGSTAASRFKVGDWVGGCLAIGPYFTVLRKDGSTVVTSGFINARVNGKLQPVDGLIFRRTYEMTVCLRGLIA